MTPIHALLVGIDRYEPPRFPDHQPIRPLSGAVNDVVRLRCYLERGPLNVPPERIRQLVSPHSWSDAPTPAPEDLPTRENLVREIRALGERAEPGDQVLIHFSGHGARVPTAVPEVKGQAAWDECLVPCDVGAGDDRCLRDVEMHALLRELASRRLAVTLILDCCHSGGLTRTGRRTHVVRGLGDLDLAAGETSPLGPWADLGVAWTDRREARSPEASRKASTPWRHLEPEPGWLPMPEGCVLLAACRPAELAREYPFGAGGYNGALTHFLLRTIGDARLPIAIGELHRRLLGRVRSLFPYQTPELQGRAAEAFLGDGQEVAWADESTTLREVLLDPARVVDGRAGSPGGKALTGAITTELFALERTEDWRTPSRRAAVDASRVRAGTVLCLLLRNRAAHELSVAVLDRRPDGGICRLHPYPGDGESATLDPGVDQPVFFRAELPDRMDRGWDRIEILVATRPMATSHLERDPIEAGGTRERPLDGEAQGRSPAPGVGVGGGLRSAVDRPSEEGGIWTSLAIDLTIERPHPASEETWWTAID